VSRALTKEKRMTSAGFLQIFSMPIPEEVDQISKSISKARKDIQVKSRGLERFKENLQVLTGSLELAKKEHQSLVVRKKKFLANNLVSLDEYKKLVDGLEHFEDLLAIYPIDIAVCQQGIQKYVDEIRRLEFDIQMYERMLKEWGQIRHFPRKRKI
jgi:hypothetical protein